ncbi:iron ABC transporter substrate-binding protein [Pseudonocardia parietis]|uniref:Iron(III) transport system substrate-binding protein n=1 Tax=Pseudonocardia parietis TaxID=570936 RepID=A0ABS4VVK7_9PSEU|nr:iron ABC transporter substrate-binding protein [Pseudonocardia parietis]MBP2367945.1 iron(III) transport system substrate-binding protein [Pseudonocardia parietis]
MTRSTRQGVLAGVFLAATLLAAGCAGGGPAPADAAPIAAADGPRTLTLYSGRDEELVGPLIAQFQQQSGITVETRYGSTTELAAQLAEEGEATPAQVFLSQDAGALGALEGSFAPLPDDVRGAVEAPYTSTDGSWVGLTGRARVAAYNVRVPEAEVPADVTDLTDPKWKGRVGIAPTNASFQAFVTALRVQEGEDAAREFLEGLRANEAQIFPRNSAILEAVNNGAVDVGLINHYYYVAAETPPANTRLKFGAPGTASALVNVTGAGILAGAAESAEAQELVRFLVSDQAQRYFATETGEYPLIPGVPSPEGVPALADLGAPAIDLADLRSLDETTQLMTQVGLL